MSAPSMRRLFGPLARLALGASFVALACSGDKPPGKGQIMLAVQTDMSIPEDVSHVRIIVFNNGAVKFDNTYQVGENGEKIPATLGLIASDDPDDTIEVRVLGIQQATVRTLSRVVTTIPQDRIATLKVPIQWLCWNQAQPTPGVTGSYDSTCEDPDQACLAGECRDVELESETLPTFTIEDIQGGGDTAETGRCLDTAPCFDRGRDVLTREGCTIAVTAQEAARLNVALVLSQRGICSDTSGLCYVPLDQDEIYGWRRIPGAPPPLLGEGGASGAGSAVPPGPGAGGDGSSPLPPDAGTVTIQLPPAVCDRLSPDAAPAVAANGVRVTGVCETKTSQNPTCGPWTVVGSESQNNGPIDDGGGIEPPPGSECPQLYVPNSATPLSDDPDVASFARLVLELSQVTNRLRADVGQACSGITQRVNGTPASYAGPAPTDAELAAACNAATAALGAASTSSYQINDSPGHCTVDTDEQLQLETACGSGCAGTDFDTRCSRAFIECDGECQGACLPRGNSLTVDCSGGCTGQCVGSCEGMCTGPGGNTLPSTNCMGYCAGICNGSCQGECSAQGGPCDGHCDGVCGGAEVSKTCEHALMAESCGPEAICEHLAAASVGIRQQCGPGSVFVTGQTAPNVAPAISDNYPRLLRAVLESSNLSFAMSSLSMVGSTLITNQGAGTAVEPCLMEAYNLFASATQSMSATLTTALSVISSVDTGGGPGAACAAMVGEDACTACGKRSCCAEAQTCSASGRCLSETACLRNCALGGGTRANCETGCASSDGTGFDPATDAFSQCFFSSCSPCSPPGQGCGQYGSNVGVDDFENADLMSILGDWRATNTLGGSASLVQPGANRSGYGLGISGEGEVGLSLDFSSCGDASLSPSLSFDAIDMIADPPAVVTVRVRTRSTEPPALGGNCAGVSCGDHFAATVELGTAWSNYSIAWTSFVNSQSRSLVPADILGIDFVIPQASTAHFAIDNVWFGAPAVPPSTMMPAPPP